MPNWGKIIWKVIEAVVPALIIKESPRPSDKIVKLSERAAKRREVPPKDGQ